MFASVSKDLRKEAGERRTLFPVVFFLLAVECGCDFINPNRRIKTMDVPIRLIAPNAVVDRLLASQGPEDAKVERFWQEKHSKEEGMDRIKQLRNSAETLYPKRMNFLSAIAHQSAEYIPGGSYLLLLEDSQVKCSGLLLNTHFLKVRVTSGQLEGKVGWVCEDDVFRTVNMP